MTLARVSPKPPGATRIQVALGDVAYSYNQSWLGQFWFGASIFKWAFVRPNYLSLRLIGKQGSQLKVPQSQNLDRFTLTK